MSRRTAIVSDASSYVGPQLARLLAERGHDLVLGDPGDDLSAPTSWIFPAFLRASRAEDPEGRARVEAQVPMGRLGQLDELAHLAGAFLDGQSRFATGQFVAFAGGWA